MPHILHIRNWEISNLYHMLFLRNLSLKTPFIIESPAITIVFLGYFWYCVSDSFIKVLIERYFKNKSSTAVLDLLISIFHKNIKNQLKVSFLVYRINKTYIFGVFFANYVMTIYRFLLKNSAFKMSRRSCVDSFC